MPELIEVIRRLEELKGIESVLLGRRIQGTALAPTFQVYLSGQLDDGFKLLARSGNQVQEVCAHICFRMILLKSFPSLVEGLDSVVAASLYVKDIYGEFI